MDDGSNRPDQEFEERLDREGETERERERENERELAPHALYRFNARTDQAKQAFKKSTVRGFGFVGGMASSRRSNPSPKFESPKL